MMNAWATTCHECRCLWRWLHPLDDQGHQGKMEVQEFKGLQGCQAALDRLAVKEDRDPWAHPVPLV